jgi:hypothetical protein
MQRITRHPRKKGKILLLVPFWDLPKASRQDLMKKAEIKRVLT